MNYKLLLELLPEEAQEMVKEIAKLLLENQYSSLILRMAAITKTDEAKIYSSIRNLAGL